MKWQELIALAGLVGELDEGKNREYVRVGAGEGLLRSVRTVAVTIVGSRYDSGIDG